MIDGKMQDDATWKQCKVMVDLAESLAATRPGAGRGLRVRRGGGLGASAPAAHLNPGAEGEEQASGDRRESERRGEAESGDEEAEIAGIHALSSDDVGRPGHSYVRAGAEPSSCASRAATAAGSCMTWS